MKKKGLLLTAFSLLFLLPYLGSYIHWDGPPPGYGEFPAQKAVEDPGFNETAFIFCSGVALVILLFLLFPRLFGFKRKPADAVDPKPEKVPYPKWFLPGLIVTLISWFFMWGRFEWANDLDHYTFVPLWWGFITTLDGVVYKRNSGRSLYSTRMDTVKIMGIASAFSWFVFEYQNFFVMENWYYPNGQIFTNFGNISWQLLSYTTVLPAIFQFYWLLRTVPLFRHKYAYGPKFQASKPMLYVMMIIGLILTFLMGLFPFVLFWMLWVSLIPTLIPVMGIKKVWSPFTEIAAKGNYTFVVLIALATLLNGFFWEFWNFGSEWFHDYMPTNPNYWKYSVPYIDKYHLFSEMPILGYFGYLFFGVVCWTLWLTIAYLFGFDPAVDDEKLSDLNSQD